jgi:hypothetical protein
METTPQPVRLDVGSYSPRESRTIVPREKNEKDQKWQEKALVRIDKVLA